MGGGRGGGEGTFLSHQADVTQPLVGTRAVHGTRDTGHGTRDTVDSGGTRELRNGESVRAAHPCAEQIRPRISDSAKGSCPVGCVNAAGLRRDPDETALLPDHGNSHGSRRT